ncbi:MAG: acyltransferase [Oscillospiraceae bacterium]|nr:acyltransferase [Oscillospiraceae bacterium]
MPEKSRQVKYDLIRAVAMVFVVLLHLLGHIQAETGTVKWWGKEAAMLLTSSCNGLFFLISGRFNLNRKSTNDIGRFYRKRAVTILIPFFISSLICFVVEDRANGANRNYLRSLITEFPGTQYWFVYFLAGLLFWAPFFASMMAELPLRKKLILTAGVLAFQTVFVALKDMGIYPGYELPLTGWALFFLVGSFADSIPDIWKKRVILLGALSYCLSVLQSGFLPQASSGLQDLSPRYFLTVLALYYGLQRVRIAPKAEKAVTWFAGYSYYVYLFHNMVLFLFFSEKVGIYDGLITKTGTILFLILAVATCFAVSVLIGTVIEKLVIVPLKKNLNAKN